MCCQSKSIEVLKNRKLQGYKSKRPYLVVSHMMFVDDTLIFYKANMVEGLRLTTVF